MAATLEYRLTLAGATTWAASTAYNQNDTVRPTTPNNYVYRCTVAGTSGSEEPTWPTTIGETVSDGTVTWECWKTEPDNSLGGIMSSTTLSETAMNNLFDNVSPDEASDGDTEYRALDIYNSGDATATNVALYMKTETSSPDTQLDLGYDSDNSPHASDANLPTISDEDTAPSGISFAHYTSSSKLSLPDIPAGQAVRVWAKRIVSANAGNTSNDLGTIAVEYA